MALASVLLMASTGGPLVLRAQHPVTGSVAPWNGAVLVSAELSYRGTSATATEQPVRLIATQQCCVLLREWVRFNQAIPDLMGGEALLVVGLTQVRHSAKVLVTIRLQGSSFCVNHGVLWPERDGSLRGRVRAVLPNEKLYLQAQLRFDREERMGRWDLVTGDGMLSIRLVFRAPRPEDGPLPPYVSAREATSIKNRNLREDEPHCRE